MTAVDERRLRQIASEILQRMDSLYRKTADPVPASDVEGVLEATLVTVRKTADQSSIGTAYADVTELSFALAENTHYAFEFVLIADADATTTGIDVAVNGPNSPTFLNVCQEYWTSTTARALAGSNVYDNNTASANSNGTAARPFRVWGTIITGASPGNLVPRAKREAVGAGPNIRAGSYGILHKLSA